MARPRTATRFVSPFPDLPVFGNAQGVPGQDFSIPSGFERAEENRLTVPRAKRRRRKKPQTTVPPLPQDTGTPPAQTFTTTPTQTDTSRLPEFPGPGATSPLVSRVTKKQLTRTQAQVQAAAKQVVSQLEPRLTDQQLRTRASAIVNEILGGQRKALEQTNAQRVQQLQAAFAQLAEISKQIAPNVGQAFTNAANTTTAAAQGFTDATARQQAEAAAGLTGQLAGLGLPQIVQSDFQRGGADTAFALGGFIPASTLAREGAAFQAAAAQLPATAAGLGVDAVRGAGNELTQQVGELEAQRPQLLFDIINQLGQRNEQRRSGQFNELAAINAGLVKQQEIAAEEKAAAGKARDRLFNQRLAYARTFGVDPQTGALSVTGKRLVAQARKNQKKARTISPNTYAQLKKDAAEAADLFYYGDQEKDILGISYQDALGRLMATYSLRLVDAQAILDGFYSPGERTRPYLSLQQRQTLIRRGVPRGRVDRAMFDPALSAQLLARL